tara:strand:+ start:96 stop:842 length:747 start_codon:yes stop_codon:yes gene_type:complete
MKFFLGTHVTNHLEKTDVPLFISRRVIGQRKSIVNTLGEWALDSGGFTELNLFGKWTISEIDYVKQLSKINRSNGLLWAAQQDWMCEPFMVKKTALTVKEHQKRTVDNIIKLRKLKPDVHIIPVLQGYSLQEYKECFELFESNNIDLRNEKLVGLGSVCRRQNNDDIERIVKYFHHKDLKLHGFGVKTRGLKKYGEMLQSSDSLAWSYGARVNQEYCEQHKKNPTTKNCANCLTYALEWRNKINNIIG